MNGCTITDHERRMAWLGFAFVLLIAMSKKAEAAAGAWADRGIEALQLIAQIAG